MHYVLGNETRKGSWDLCSEGNFGMPVDIGVVPSYESYTSYIIIFFCVVTAVEIKGPSRLLQPSSVSDGEQ
jgi:hypothetical protein